MELDSVGQGGRGGGACTYQEGGAHLLVRALQCLKLHHFTLFFLELLPVTEEAETREGGNGSLGTPALGELAGPPADLVGHLCDLTVGPGDLMGTMEATAAWHTFT